MAADQQPSDLPAEIAKMLREVDEDFQPSELYYLIAKTAGEAGWNDPAMDVYDRYDEHRGQG